MLIKFKTIKNLFINKYVNKGAIKNNCLMLLLYNIATPTSMLFVKLSISPNTITSISILFSIIAFLFLILSKGFLFFMVFWSLAIYLDFCDGTVARMINKKSEYAFNYDHMSDIFKTSLVLLGVGLRYNSKIVWIFTFVSLFLFLYMTILNHDLGHYKNNIDIKETDTLSIVKQTWIISMFNSMKSIPLLANLLTIFMTINAHTLFGFLLFPLGEFQTTIFLMYFIIITTFISIRVLKKLVILKIN